MTKAGGQLIGSLTSTFNPYKPMEIVTKKQSEELVDSYRVVLVMLLENLWTLLRLDFLKCNGGVVDKKCMLTCTL